MSFKIILNANFSNWRTNCGYTDSSIMDVPQTPQEQEVFIRVLQMQIDMDIEPVPTTYSWLTKTSTNQWKVNKLSTLQKNELSLLRGEVINDMVGEPALFIS